MNQNKMRRECFQGHCAKKYLTSKNNIFWKCITFKTPKAFNLFYWKLNFANAVDTPCLSNKSLHHGALLRSIAWLNAFTRLFIFNSVCIQGTQRKPFGWIPGGKWTFFSYASLSVRGLVTHNIFEHALSLKTSLHCVQPDSRHFLPCINKAHDNYEYTGQKLNHERCVITLKAWFRRKRMNQIKIDLKANQTHRRS